MLDIEALGVRPGAAVIELAAVAFSLETGKLGETFERHIIPHKGLHHDLETIEWHIRQGTWPPDIRTSPVNLEDALGDFAAWVAELGEPHTIWSWGSTYDFPLLDAAARAAGAELPWRYYQTACARTAWRMAFPHQKHAPRPHTALADATAAVGDLLKAFNQLRTAA